MIFLCLFVVTITLYGMKYDTKQTYFLSKDYSQNWKGILCILIMMTHILEKYNWPNVLYNIHSFGYIEVAIFFLFSGYGLKYSYNNNPEYIKTFFRKRFIKIYLPYLICSLVCYILKGMTINGDSYWRLRDIVRIVIGINAIWFVKALLIFYLAFGIIYRLFKKKANIVMSLFTICYIIICYLIDMDKTWYSSVIPFMMGIYIADNIEQIKCKPMCKKNIAVFAFLSIVFEVLYQLFKDDKFWGSLITRNILCITIVMFFLLVTRRLNIGNKITQFMGKISYEFFLVHFSVIAIVKRTYNYLSIDIQALLIFVITVGIAYILNKLNSGIIKKIVG